MQGWIKDHRKELESDIWRMPPLYHRVWQWLKYQVNYADAEIPMSDGTKFIVKKGQHLTSIRNIARAIGWHEGLVWKEPNPKTISQIIGWLEKNGMITVERGRGNRQFTLITLVKWDFYQLDEGHVVTASTTAREQLLDINKNIKNEKNEKERDLKDYISLPTDDPFLKIYEIHFRKSRKKEHPRITEQQLQHIIHNIEMLQEWEITAEDFEEQVRDHFETLAKDNNGSILAFIPSFMRRFEIPYTGFEV
ncbi:hypothetical protein [Paenibacillus stellifer]|uniref:hypothetical protein n=1 Tax=Paenibacillus stellifer TaxID=169760 RepID=UPI00068A3FC7|nr:hypothetical protein [Paenibacillus stellifer]